MARFDLKVRTEQEIREEMKALLKQRKELPVGIAYRIVNERLTALAWVCLNPKIDRLTLTNKIVEFSEGLW